MRLVLLLCLAGLMRTVFASSPSATYNLLVIGGGSAGIGAAKYAAKFGKTVALIEKDRFGGDCTWSGCVPSKTLLASAKAAHAARTAPKYGVATSDVTVDMRAVKARIQAAVQRIYDADDSPEAFARQGIDAVEGEATLVDRRTVRVAPAAGAAPRTLRATDGIIVATGAGPRAPPIDGLDGVPHLTYEGVFELEEVPKRMTVVGGGPIGCELAQAFSRLGAAVTLVAPRLLPSDETEAGETLERAFAAEGVTVVKGRASSVRAEGGTSHALTALVDGVAVDVLGDALVVAVGRSPNVRGFGLETLGVKLDEASGGIAVDEKLRTSVRGVYAVGDCTGDQQFTHYAGFQGAYAAINAFLHLGPLSFTGVLGAEVPATTFTSPEVGRVGLTEAEAARVHGADKVASRLVRLSHTDRAICDGTDEHGFLKLVRPPPAPLTRARTRRLRRHGRARLHGACPPC
jgi:pyruvate/2-oxoglutarate dehydrogenase complex dihydrolipoamide dehydrogenase (E3) component